MFTGSTKILVAALVLAAASLAVVADASARPTRGGWQAGWPACCDTTPRERHDPTNTNGG